MEERMGRQPTAASAKKAPLPAGKTYFLGIGIDAYDPWSKLHNAVGDVKAIVALLENKYGLDKDNVFLLLDENAGEDAIIFQLEQMAHIVTEHDSLLIYYAGHGHLDEHENGFWIPADGPLDKKNRWIRNSTLINDYIAKINSLHTLLISDSCYSGSIFNSTQRSGQERAQELMQLRSRWAICSGRGNQSVADGKAGERSPFAKAILDALGKTEQTYVTARWLLEQVAEQTRANHDQLPDGGPLNGVGHERGQFVFQRKKLVENVRSKKEDRQQVNLAGELAKYNCNRRGILDCFWENFEQAEQKQTPLHLFFLHFDRDQMSETLVNRIITELHLKKAGVKWSGFTDTPIRDVVFSANTSPERQGERLKLQLLKLLEAPADCRGDQLSDFLQYLEQHPSPKYQDYTYLPYVLDIVIPENLWATSKTVLQAFLEKHLSLSARGRWVPVFFLTLHIKKARTSTRAPERPRFFGLFQSKQPAPVDPVQEIEQLLQRLLATQQQGSTFLPPLRSVDEDDLHDWSKQFRKELSEIERTQIVERIIDKLAPSDIGWPMKAVTPHLIRVCEEIKNAVKYI